MKLFGPHSPLRSDIDLLACYGAGWRTRCSALVAPFLAGSLRGRAWPLNGGLLLERDLDGGGHRPSGVQRSMDGTIGECWTLRRAVHLAEQ
ncbi:MAG TPA: hypothetical protein VMW75_17890 [Thermoanaerobaculia bacterium]|nr:hypothetical protein [Thermoanaerobaculia bacterium]